MIEGIIHFRYQGESREVQSASLDIGDASTNSEILAALARHYDIPLNDIRNFEVQREQSGSYTVHPPATFG